MELTQAALAACVCVKGAIHTRCKVRSLLTIRDTMQACACDMT